MFRAKFRSPRNRWAYFRVCQGSCLQGFFCQGGATAPAPPSSDSSPQNGPCPSGHYCPAGCISPIPCPLGSIRNTTGIFLAQTCHGNVCIHRISNGCPPVSGGGSMESCSSCPAGQYCSTEGLARPSGPCGAGFYCPFDFSSTTPYTFLCPRVSQIQLPFIFLFTFMPSLPSFTKSHDSNVPLLLCYHCLIGPLLS